MIDLEKEPLITMADATGLPMVCPGGRRPHLATVFRWTTRGVKGVKLETVQVGGHRCTSVAAVERFIRALSAAGTNEMPADSAPPQHTSRAIAAAKKRLAAVGI